MAFLKKTLKNAENAGKEDGAASGKKGRKPALRIAAFIAVFCALLAGASRLFLQIHGQGNGQGVTGIAGFYDMPGNSIETVFVGASIAGCGINTPLLYEKYGICSYNLSVSWQPVMASYYWVKDTYRLHSGTLKTVVLDVSTLRHVNESMKYYKASIDCMNLSGIKMEAVRAYSKTLNQVITNLIPLFFYHDRWTGNLGKSDFTGFKYVPENVLGYEFFYKRSLDSMSWNDLGIRTGFLNMDAKGADFGEEACEYLSKLIEFCEEKGLDLILIKVPHDDWTAAHHNAVQVIADENELPFFDFNFNPLFDELGFNIASDTVDERHANKYGADKITTYLGEWLSQNTAVSDVRGEVRYAFMEDELAKYHRRVTDVMALKEETDPADYIEKAMQNADNEIYLAVKDSISGSLTPRQRAKLAWLGLSVLAEQTERSSYLGVIEGGQVLEELTVRFDSEAYDAAAEAGEAFDYETLTCEKLTPDGSLVQLESGGLRMGNVASCKIDGTEYADNTRGLNIVVYNRELRRVVDTAVFDLSASSTRETYSLESAYEEAMAAGTPFAELSDTLQKYVLYNRRTALGRQAALLEMETGDDGLLPFLLTWMGTQDTAIFLSVRDEASNKLDQETREFLAELGFAELAGINFRDSYLGAVYDGEVLYEETGHGEEPLLYRIPGVTVESGGNESGNCSSVLIGGTEYSPRGRGINLVVYDLLTETVVDTAVFDTYKTACRLPE